MYLISGSFTTPVPTALIAQSLQSPADTTTWHQCFSHFGISHIKEASKLVDGLSITKDNLTGLCKDCVIANMKRCLYNDHLFPETTILHTTSIDLWGPAHVKSTRGALYTMKFYDRGSSYRQTFFLPNRQAETVLNTLKTYKAESEKMMGQLIVFIQTNNAPEFYSALWKDYFCEEGLIFDPTVPYSLASNSTAKYSIGITTAAI